MFPEVSVEEVWVPMRDGVRLSTDVVIPKKGGPFPVRLFRTPYGRAGCWGAYTPVALARQGYAVIVQDARGCHRSEGRYGGFPQEGPDGADTMAWALGQPWCNGRFAMTGHSYVALAAWMAALEAPKNVAALGPMIMTTAFGRSITHENGVFQQAMWQKWGLQQVIDNPRHSPAARRRALKLVDDYEKLFRIPLGKDPISHVLAPYSDWIDTSSKDGPSVAKRRPRIPAYQIAGWYDPFVEGALQAHSVLQAEGVPSRIVVGPWSHGVFGPNIGQMDFGPKADGLAIKMGEQFNRWIDRAVLKEQDPGESGARIFVMGTNTWREFDTWPPRADEKRLFLGEHGSLTNTAALSSAADRYRYDPKDPAPTLGGRTLGPPPWAPGVFEQSAVESRADVLVYTSQPLSRSVTVVGPVRADIWFASSAPSADVTVKLTDVHPNGESFNVVDSVRRTDLTPGRAKRVKVEVGSVAITFKKGHRIRIQVASSNWPRLALNPSTGEPSETAISLAAADQSVFHGGRRASCLILPVV